MNGVKPSKVPSRTVKSDDLVISVDGVDYKPHAGESVTFRGRLSVDDYLLSVAFANLDAADPSGVSQAVAEAIERLQARIVSWTWTDDDGEPMPEPTVDVLRRLSFEEIGWLMSHGQGSSDQGEA